MIARRSHNRLPKRVSNRASLDFLWNVHNYINEYIRFSDTKAALVLTYISVIIGTIYSEGLLPPHLSTPMLMWSFREVSGVAALMCSVLAAAMCAAAVVPRLGGKRHAGFLFWNDILGHSDGAAFCTSLGKCTSSDLARHLSEHVYQLSRIAKRKYLWVTRAIFAALAGSIITALLLFA